MAGRPDLLPSPGSFLSETEAVLRQAGVELGKTYPLPIVDHDHARKAALEAYAHIKAGGS